MSASNVLYRQWRLDGPNAWAFVVAFVKANASAFVERGRPLLVIITEDIKKRTDPQNRRYWGHVLTTIAEQAWVGGRRFHKDCWHEQFARDFGFSEEMLLPDGEIVIRRKSTTEMSVTEFNEYMAKVEAFAATELGVRFDA